MSGLAVTFFNILVLATIHNSKTKTELKHLQPCSRFDQQNLFEETSVAFLQ